MAVKLIDDKLVITNISIPAKFFRGDAVCAKQYLFNMCPELEKYCKISQLPHPLESTPVDELTEDIYCEIIKSKPQYIQKIPKHLHTKKMVLEVVRCDTGLFRYCNQEIIDKEIAIATVTSTCGDGGYNSGWMIGIVGDFKYDYDVVYAAVKHEHDNLFAGAFYWYENATAYGSIPNQFYKNPDLAILAIETHPKAITRFNTKLYKNITFIHRLLNARISLSFLPDPQKTALLKGRQLYTLNVSMVIIEDLLLCIFDLQLN